MDDGGLGSAVGGGVVVVVGDTDRSVDDCMWRSVAIQHLRSPLQGNLSPHAMTPKSAFVVASQM